jgi:hypothetical protein
MQASAMLLSVVMLGFALGVGLIFTFAGLSHWRHRRLLSGVVANYRLLPDGMVNPVAAVLPWAELALGLGLLLSPVMPVLGRGQTWSGAQSCSFWLGHGGEPAARARHIDCGCGHAELRQPLNWLLVAQYCAGSAFAGSGGVGAELPGGMALMAVMVAALAVWLGYHLFNALAALQSSPLSATLLPTRR